MSNSSPAKCSHSGPRVRGSVTCVTSKTGLRHSIRRLRYAYAAPTFSGRLEKKSLDIRAVGQPSLVAGPVFKTGEGQRELSLASSIPVLYRHFLS